MIIANMTTCMIIATVLSRIASLTQRALICEIKLEQCTLRKKRFDRSIDSKNVSGVTTKDDES